jgi:hypothetical protein
MRFEVFIGAGLIPRPKESYQMSKRIHKEKRERRRYEVFKALKIKFVFSFPDCYAV